MDEAQIARAQEWTFSARQVGPEGTLALFRVLPVALCNAGTGYPDLTYAVGRKLCQRLGIGDDHFLSLQYRPKTDQRARTLRPGGRFDRFVVCKRRTVKRLVRRSVEAAADKEGRLGEAVAGEKGFAPEAARRKSRRELLQSFGAHRFRAIGSRHPTAQVQHLLLLGRNLAHAEIVGKVGCAS